MASFSLVGQTVVSVTRAEHVRKVLLASNFRNDIPLINKHLRAFLGNRSLVLLMHGEWKAHRHIMTRAFHHEHLKGMVADFSEVADALVARLVEQAEPAGGSNSGGAHKVNVVPVLKMATLDAIGLTAFGYRFDTLKNGSHPVVSAFEYLLDETTRRQFEAPLSLEALWAGLPTASNRRLKREVAVLRACVDGIVAARAAEGPARRDCHDDLLKHMLAAREAEGAGAISDEALGDNLLTLVFGGFDTTSIALTYVLYLVAQHPEVEAAALAEVERVLGDRRAIVHEDMGSLVYCAAVVTEALRLYPPAPLTVRTLEAPLELEGSPSGETKTLPAGTMVYLPIWWIHRDKRNWGADAEQFRPERHLKSGDEAQTKSASSFRMVAFSGGQRNCPGQRFAMTEATILFVTLLRGLSFSVAEESRGLAPVSTGVVQKPRGGELWMHVAPRGCHG